MIGAALLATLSLLPSMPRSADTIPLVDAHRLAHDNVRNRLLLFSGLQSGAQGAARYRTSLFASTADGWERVADGGPWGRDDAQLAFDGKRNRLVLFGGRQVLADRSVRVLTDTWEWDGSAWARVDTVGPGMRTHAGMAYDAARGVTVIFGGFGANDSLRADTWEWDGTHWTRRADGPAGRWVNGLTYDPVRKRVVLHAGDRARYDRATDLAAGEVFEWNGAAWTKAGDARPLSPQQPIVGTSGGLLWYNGWQKDTPAESWMMRGGAWTQVPGVQPPRRRGAAMTYDAARNVVVLIGGENDDGALRDRWEFDGTKWMSITTVHAPAPERRAHHAVAWSPSHQMVVMHGGSSPRGERIDMFNDLWGFDGTRWQPLSANGPGISGMQLFADTAGVLHRVTGFDGRSEIADAARLVDTTWQALGAFPGGARAEAALAFDTDRGRAVFYGGMIPGRRVSGETWELADGAWTRTATEGPGPLHSASMAYDAARRMTILFGGADSAFVKNGTTWGWDGTRWQRLATTGPSPRFTAGMAYDAARREVVLFGGSGESGNAETWLWNGTTWRQYDGPTPPSRMMPRMAYDPVRRVVVMFGGRAAWPNDLGDTWTWNGTSWTEVRTR